MARSISWKNKYTCLTAIIAFVIALCTATTTASTKEQETLVGKQYKFAPFDLNNELRHPGIETLYEDRLGRIWIGTQLGLNVSLGNSVDAPTNELVSEPSIFKIKSLGIGTELLIGTANGLVSFNPESEKVKKWSGTSKGTAIFMIEQRSSEFLVGTEEGLYIGYPNDHRLELVEATKDLSVRSIHQASKESLYLGTRQGLFLINDGIISEVTALRGQSVDAIYRSNESFILVTDLAGIFEINDDHEIIRRMPLSPDQENGIPGSKIRSSLLASDGSIWLGTDSGIAIVRDFRLQFKTNDSSQLPHPLVTSFLEDSAGNVWSATLGGITKTKRNGQSFAHFSNENTQGILGNSIISFFQSQQGELWVSSLEGLTRWDATNSTFTSQPFRPLGSKEPRVSAITQLSDKILFGTMNNGLYISSDKEITDETSFSKLIEAKAKHIPKLVSLTGDRSLVATINDGIFIIEPITGSVPFESGSGDPSFRSVIDIELSNDYTAWVVSLHGTLSSIDLKTYENRTWKLNESSTSTESPLHISSVGIVNGEIWLGTLNDGVVSFHPETETTKFYSGLTSKLVYAIEIDNNGLVWASTSRGLTRINPETDEVQNFGKGHGLQVEDFNSGASLKMRDGTLLFGGNNGFNAFNPRDIKLNDHKGQTLITSFSKMNELVPRRYLSDGSETVELDYTENVFSFEFALMDFASAKDNTYEYQLVGFDEDWVASGTKNTATYTNLEAGTYTFQVRGTNNDGLTTDKLGYLNVVITPPPWLTWYAYLAYGLIALALSIFAFRLYAKRVERLTIERRNAEEKERLEGLVAERTEQLNEKLEELSKTLRQKEIANKEIHHRVKNNLQVILGLLTLQAESHESELFQDAMNQIRQRITSMSLIHKSLYENHVASIDFRQYTENLVGSIREFHPALAGGNIDVLLDVDAEVLDIDTALPIGLILNELITNSIKHGFKNRTSGDALNMIRIVFKRVGDNFKLEVIDNGAGLPSGFDVQSPTSMGSELTLIFSEQLGGEIIAEQPATGGAAFRFTFPVPEIEIAGADET